MMAFLPGKDFPVEVVEVVENVVRKVKFWKMV
jgi:hypothetical protein